MESETRRQKIIELLKKQEEPISGSQLAEQSSGHRKGYGDDQSGRTAFACDSKRVFAPERNRWLMQTGNPCMP